MSVGRGGHVSVSTQAHPGVPFDSYRYLDFISRQVMKAWAERGLRARPGDVPWTPLRVPLAKARVALLSTAAVALKDDKPFDAEGERRNPWWGDPSHRIIPRGTRTEQVQLHHLHVDCSFGERDLNVVLPLDRLEELAAEGVVGEVAPSHYSMMGYILREAELMARTVPAIIASLRAEAVDVLALVPA
jgi:D-proline reductase (dithiol) PrdB